jgi:hypothetical protein
MCAREYMLRAREALCDMGTKRDKTSNSATQDGCAGLIDQNYNPNLLLMPRHCHTQPHSRNVLRQPLKACRTNENSLPLHSAVYLLEGASTHAPSL